MYGVRPSDDPLFDQHRYYCAHCPVLPTAESWMSHGGVKTHCESVHDIPYSDAKIAVDYYQGWQAEKKYRARQVVAEAEFRFPAFEDPNYGVEDFLIDIGEEPWESRLSYEDDE